MNMTLWVVIKLPDVHDPPARARARPCFGTVLALKFVYYLDGKKAAMNSMPDDASILTYEKAEGNYCRLAG
jgi:hypothetical protein